MASTSLTGLRAWLSHCQGLNALAPLAPDDGLAATGWSRTLGGANPYVTAFARFGTSRPEMDKAVAELSIHELPSARGCTYVLPAADFALGLRLAQRAARAPLRELARLGVDEAAVRAIADDVVGALDKAGGPLLPAQLRERVEVPSLGEAGKNKGLATPLPTALGILQAEAAIRRVPVDGRLDNQRYAYTVWEGAPEPGKISPQEANAQLADRYFRWAGAASLAQFRWFSSLGVRDAKAAAGGLELVPLADTDAPWLRGAGPGDIEALGDLLVHPARASELASFEAPPEPAYRLVAWVDGIMLLRRDLAALLDEADVAAVAAIGGPGGLSDMPTQAIMDRGRIAGVWEYDSDAGRIVAATFSHVEQDPASAAAQALAAEIGRMEAYIARDLGDMTGSVMDNIKTRRPRIEKIAALREA